MWPEEPPANRCEPLGVKIQLFTCLTICNFSSESRRASFTTSKSKRAPSGLPAARKAPLGAKANESTPHSRSANRRTSLGLLPPAAGRRASAPLLALGVLGLLPMLGLLGRALKLADASTPILPS